MEKGELLQLSGETNFKPIPSQQQHIALYLDSLFFNKDYAYFLFN